MFREPFQQTCRNCGGAGYIIVTHDFEIENRECRACHGTGLSIEARELEKELEDVFTCKHCGAKKVHYRKWGYKCPHRCDDKD